MSIGESPRHKESDIDVNDLLFENLPNYEVILAFDLSQVHRDLRLIPFEFDIPESLVKGQEENITTEHQDTVREYIVDQGALVALSNSLNDPLSEERGITLVSLDTLQQLLSGNKKTQEEFK